jgi:hypothetical protein
MILGYSGGKSCFSLVDFIETNGNFKEKFKKFEQAFKRDEVMECRI